MGVKGEGRLRVLLTLKSTGQRRPDRAALQVARGPDSTCRCGALLQEDELPDWIAWPVLRPAPAGLTSWLWSRLLGLTLGNLRPGLAGQFEVEPPIFGVPVHRHPSDYSLGPGLGGWRKGPSYCEPLVPLEPVFQKSQLIGREVPSPTGLSQPPVTARPYLGFGRLGRCRNRSGDEDSRETDLPRSNSGRHATLHNSTAV